MKALDFLPDPLQTSILDSPSPRGIVVCSRQWGKTTTIALKALHHALHTDKALVLVIANVQRQSAELTLKIKSFLAKLQIPAKGDGLHPHSVKLPNGSRILALPCREATIRGYSGCTFLILDEAARIPDPVFHSACGFLAATSAPLWLLSTPNGQRGFFYDIWRSSGRDRPRSASPRTSGAHYPSSVPPWTDEATPPFGNTSADKPRPDRSGSPPAETKRPSPATPTPVPPAGVCGAGLQPAAGASAPEFNQKPGPAAPDFPYHRTLATAEACPRIAPRFLDWQRATLPDDIFRQEYLCDFIADGEALLDPELIFRAIDPSIQPLFGGKRIFS